MRTVAGVGAAVLALSSSGEIVLLAVLLGVAAGDTVVGAVAVLATGAAALRWGTTSLDAIAGAQTVLGPAVAVGPLVAVGSAWCAAAALILIKAPGPGAVVFGLTAGLIAAGPSGGPGPVAVRIAAAALGAGLAVAAQHRAPSAARPAAMVLAAGAVILAGVS
ncbi:MAG TPA: hypothetical protein VMZ51_05850 [Acidimicrobiales bacterium]|nr:hypothetical protein [Acidimicrobiales bacterium]